MSPDLISFLDASTARNPAICLTDFTIKTEAQHAASVLLAKTGALVAGT
jgi:hypothetical protein